MYLRYKAHKYSIKDYLKSESSGSIIIGKVALTKPERWLSISGQVAQIGADYSFFSKSIISM